MNETVTVIHYDADAEIIYTAVIVQANVYMSRTMESTTFIDPSITN